MLLQRGLVALGVAGVVWAVLWPSSPQLVVYCPWLAGEASGGAGDGRVPVFGPAPLADHHVAVEVVAGRCAVVGGGYDGLREMDATELRRCAVRASSVGGSCCAHHHTALPMCAPRVPGQCAVVIAPSRQARRPRRAIDATAARDMRAGACRLRVSFLCTRACAE